MWTEAELRERADLLRLELIPVGADAFELKQSESGEIVYAGTSLEVAEWMNVQQAGE